MRAFLRGPAAAAGILGALFLAAPVVHAQIKPAIEAPVNGGDEPKNGSSVVLTLKDGKKVAGTYVRQADGMVYVRTKSRIIPTAVRGDDITKLEQGIIPAGGRAQGAYGPEIHRVTVYNGPERTVHYIAPNLSPEELSRLNELEAAENEYGRLNNLASLTQEYLRNEQNLEKYRYEAERNYYRFSALGSMGFYPGNGNIAFPNYGFVNFAGSPYTAMGSAYSGNGYLTSGWQAGNLGIVPNAPGYYYGSSYPPPPGQAMGNEGVIKTTIGASLLRQFTPEALTQAKHTLDEARSHVIFQGDQVVAISTDQAAYKRGDRLVVTPKEGRPIVGTVVSSTGERLVIRTHPNAAPVTLRWSNIETVEPQAIKGAATP